MSAQNIFTKIRGADIKEIELFMLLVSVWVSLLMGLHKYFYSPLDKSFIDTLSNYYYLFNIIFFFSLFISLFGFCAYLGKYTRLITSWLLISGFYWVILTTLALIFQPFSIMFGVCAFFVTTSFYLYSSQINIRNSNVLSRRPEDKQSSRKNFS